MSLQTTAELRQAGRQVGEGRRPFTFSATGQDRIQLLAWKRTHNLEVSSVLLPQSCRHLKIPLGPGTSWQNPSEALPFPALLRSLRPCHLGGDLGHVCPIARAKAHLFPNREPEKDGGQMTAFLRPRFRDKDELWEGHPPTIASWIQDQTDSPTQRLMHASLER